MSAIEDSLGTALKAQSAITSLLATITLASGTTPAITPLQGVENFTNQFPRIIYLRTSNTPVYSDAGRAGIATANFTIECQGTTIAAAASVRDAVKTYLDTLINNVAVGGNKAHYCFIRDEYDQPYPAIHGEEKGIQAKTLEIEVGYS